MKYTHSLDRTAKSNAFTSLCIHSKDIAEAIAGHIAMTFRTEMFANSLCQPASLKASSLYDGNAIGIIKWPESSQLSLSANIWPTKLI